MAAEAFHRFPSLPRELRDVIWRHCLPHRVVELDKPDWDWYLNFGTYSPYSRSDTHPQRLCELWQTFRRNRHAPVITRVCHESRTVAFETALQFRFDNPHLKSFATNKTPMWADTARDTLHMHWHTFLSAPADNIGAGPLNLHVDFSSNCYTASISADLLDSVDRVDRKAIMQCLMKRPSWSVCGAVVCIHATDQAAILESGLWGLLGEEPVVLVDARNTKRVAMFRKFWQAYGTEEDIETKAYFDACVDGVPKVHYLETPSEFLQDLEIRWLHDRILDGDTHADVGKLQREAWLMTPDNFDGRDDDPRQADYGGLPGRPFARQLWSPNREHPWVQDQLTQMPVFQPTVMFRLCIDDCLSKRHDNDGDDGMSQD